MKDTDETTGSHLSLAQLLAYQQNQVTEEEQDTIEEHFVHCRACTEQSIDLARFLRPGKEEESRAANEPAGPAPAEPVSIWQGVRESAAPRSQSWYEQTTLLQAMAAALLVAAVLAPFVVWKSAQRQLAHFLEAEPNLPVVGLEAAAFRRDVGQPAPPPAVVPPGALLILLPELEPENADHMAEILTAADERIDLIPGLRRTELGQFHLRLPRNLLSGATYRIRIRYPGQDHAEEFLVLVASPGTR
jgi:hypothetical protein